MTEFEKWAKRAGLNYDYFNQLPQKAEAGWSFQHVHTAFDAAWQAATDRAAGIADDVISSMTPMLHDEERRYLKMRLGQAIRADDD